MNNETSLDEIRKKALLSIEKDERKLKLGIAGIAIYEGALLLLFIFMADWKNPTHQLIFVSSLLVYGTIGFGLVALGFFMKINTSRVLKAIEILLEK